LCFLNYSHQLCRRVRFLSYNLSWLFCVWLCFRLRGKWTDCRSPERSTLFQKAWCWTCV